MIKPPRSSENATWSLPRLPTIKLSICQAACLLVGASSPDWNAGQLKWSTKSQREVIGADELFQGLVVEAYTTLFFWKEILEGDQGSYRSVST
jgi:hypothetical protein